jgi:hypothetical protein
VLSHEGQYSDLRRAAFMIENSDHHHDDDDENSIRYLVCFLPDP